MTMPGSDCGTLLGGASQSRNTTPMADPLVSQMWNAMTTTTGPYWAAAQPTAINGQYTTIPYPGNALGQGYQVPAVNWPQTAMPGQWQVINMPSLNPTPHPNWLKEAWAKVMETFRCGDTQQLSTYLKYIDMCSSGFGNGPQSSQPVKEDDKWHDPIFSLSELEAAADMIAEMEDASA